MLEVSKIKWHADVVPTEGEDEEDLDDFREVEAHYKVMAHLIQKYNHNKEWLTKNAPVLLSEEESLKHV